MNRRSLRLVVLAGLVVGLLLVAFAASAEWLVTGVGSGNAMADTWATTTTTTVPPEPEVCDGVDNDHNGEIDEGLGYCFDGVPAPNTDGEVCLEGFSDLDGDPINGCEVILPSMSP